jgi:hypothetical protein
MLNFFTRALIKRQLKHLPEAEVDKLLAVIEKNPDYFQKMATEIKKKMDSGMSQEEAAKAVMAADGDTVKKMFAGE